MTSVIKEDVVHYIELFDTRNPDWGYSIDSSVWESADRNPLNVDDDSCFAFRFFDRTKYTLSNGETFYSKPTNYSGKYYYGKRLTEEELQDVYNIMPSHKHIKSMILSERGGLFTDISEQDMTIDEYINEISKQKDGPVGSLKLIKIN